MAWASGIRRESVVARESALQCALHLKKALKNSETDFSQEVTKRTKATKTSNDLGAFVAF